MTPRPETNLLICHGILAPRARWRARVVAYGRVAQEPMAALAPASDGAREHTKPRAWTWAALMHRAFGIDVLACTQCGGRLRLIATLHDPVVIALARSGHSPGPAPTHVRRCRVLIGSARAVPAPRGGIRADSAGPPAD